MPRILGLDFGTRRVGAALSDPRRLIATPLEVYERRDPTRDAAHYRDLIRIHEVDRIVVGLPLHTGGGAGTSTLQARDFGAWIASESSLLVVYFDERYSTVEAEEALRAAGVRPRDRRQRRDMLAARIFLQAYLDAGCPLVEAPAAPLDDEAID